MSDRLQQILAMTREEVARRKYAMWTRERKIEPAVEDCDLEMAEAFYSLRSMVQEPTRGFLRTLNERIAISGLALIAEIKKASPSKGVIRPDFDAPAHARAYAAGGAACLSVLTDEPHFLGSLEYLEAARAATTLPLLRKDFIVDDWQISEARMHGADAILLIAAALDDAELSDFESHAFEKGMDVLVEVHDEAELDRALRLRTTLIGVNNRDLKTFEVDSRRAWQLAARVPAGYTIVSESGIATHADLQAAADHGIRAFLVGESLMRQPDVEAATRALLSPLPLAGEGQPPQAAG